MQYGKRALIFLILIAIAIGLGAFNFYLWKLQAGKKQIIGGLEAQVLLHAKENKLLAERNQGKTKEILMLQSPDSQYIYEERAREEYGMIGNNETYFMLSKQELNRIPDIAGLIDSAGKEEPNQKNNMIAPPNTSVVRLESIVEPPAVSPAAPAEIEQESAETTAEPPPLLQLESLQ